MLLINARQLFLPGLAYNAVIQLFCVAAVPLFANSSNPHKLSKNTRLSHRLSYTAMSQHIGCITSLRLYTRHTHACIRARNFLNRSIYSSGWRSYTSASEHWLDRLFLAHRYVGVVYIVVIARTRVTDM